MELKGKRALVTGSSRGIGRAIAIKLAEQGVLVGVHYYENEDAAKDTLNKVKEAGSNGFIVQADVMKVDDIRRLADRVKKEWGSVDFFVNNARPDFTNFYRPPLEINVEQWKTALDSQATAFLVGCQSFLPIMNNGGRIIAVTHTPGGRTGSWQPWIGMGAAKAALDAMVRYFACAPAVAGKNITVNAISPGAIFGPDNTVEGAVLVKLPPEVQKATKEWHAAGWTPSRRCGTPRDVANAAMLICMEESAWLTGMVFFADGGGSLMDTVFPLEIQLGGSK